MGVTLFALQRFLDAEQAYFGAIKVRPSHSSACLGTISVKALSLHCLLWRHQSEALPLHCLLK